MLLLAVDEARISMDGWGRWTDNLLIQRLRRSLKYEFIYLHALEHGSEQRSSFTR
jgi:putative transposase